jgi:hypothetical protein
MAMGGRQQQEEIIRAQVAGCIPLSQYRSKIMFTDDLLSPGGHLRAKAKLEGCSRPKAVIIGGSHSAFSSAWTLLNKLGSVPFSEHAITLMHRSKLKLFYNNREEALADGYTDFTDEDICPVTKRINRMGGIRWDSKSLLRKLIGLGEEKEPRMQLLKIEDDERTADRIRQLLDECSLLVPALGYRPATIPVYNAQLEPVSLHCHHGGPLVNNRSQVLGEQGLPLPGMFGAGLASGFMPGGKMGGEPSFNKQTNSLWAYQNDIGEMITAQLLERSFMPIGRAA